MPPFRPSPLSQTPRSRHHSPPSSSSYSYSSSSRSSSDLPLREPHRPYHRSGHTRYRDNNSDTKHRSAPSRSPRKRHRRATRHSRFYPEDSYSEGERRWHKPSHSRQGRDRDERHSFDRGRVSQRRRRSPRAHSDSEERTPSRGRDKRQSRSGERHGQERGRRRTRTERSGENRRRSRYGYDEWGEYLESRRDRVDAGSKREGDKHVRHRMGSTERWERNTKEGYGERRGAREYQSDMRQGAEEERGEEKQVMRDQFYHGHGGREYITGTVYGRHEAEDVRGGELRSRKPSGWGERRISSSRNLSGRKGTTGQPDPSREEWRSEYLDEAWTEKAKLGVEYGRQSRWDQGGRRSVEQQKRALHVQSALERESGGERTAPTRQDAQEMDAGERGRKEVPVGGLRNRDWLDDTPEEGETRWQKRRKMRESFVERVNVWDVSPEPPRRIEDRFDVGADERKKKERKRKRKEERRLRREGKRAKLAAEAKDRGGSTGLKEAVEREEGEKNPIAPDADDGDGELLGPALPNAEREGVSRNVDYGKALRPGEGSKMAAFVQDGARIPRRGEIGLTGDEIAKYEAQGYVMSGSRNRRMEAVRIRKENQIYSAEELAALSQFSHEERKLREERIMNQFQALVESKIGEDPRQNGEVAKVSTKEFQNE